MAELSRLRPLFVAQILYNCTDENHLITIAQIIEKLRSEHGIEAFRTTVKDDIDKLIEAGMDIEFVKSSQNKYHIVSREFDIAELKILADAVESSKFITKEKSASLTAKLGKLCGQYGAAELRRNIEVENRAKSENELIYYIVDKINEAINAQKKISFRYFSYNEKKEQIERHDGEVYVFSPYKLVWNGDYYYTVGYSDKHDNISSFRVDRIAKIPQVLDDRAVSQPDGFDMDVYLNTMFRMYGGERKSVLLECANDVMDSVIDRFGKDVNVTENGESTFNISVDIVPSHIFYSWVFGFDGKVKIVAPADVKQGYRDMVGRAEEK